MRHFILSGIRIRPNLHLLRCVVDLLYKLHGTSLYQIKSLPQIHNIWTLLVVRLVVQQNSQQIEVVELGPDKKLKTVG